MEEKAARTKQEHLNEINSLNVKHSQREAEHQRIVSKLMSDWEAMRLQKDSEILQLNRDTESQRSGYEKRIIALESVVISQKQTICQFESKILELNNILTRKADVEDQLRMAKDHEAQMDRAKQEL